MKISYNWLRSYIELKESPAEVSEILTSIGLEVSTIEGILALEDSLKDIKIGKINNICKHPNADRLSIAQVELADDNLKIVCGAKNISVGQKVPVATINSYIGIKGKKLKIVKTSIRGEVSEGMLCSQEELGIGKDNKGIMILNQEAKLGGNMYDFMKDNGIQNDYIFDIELTPNRNDAMSHLGVARDLKAALNHRKQLKIKIKDDNITNKLEGIKQEQNNIDLVINSKKDIKRYACISMSNIKVKESPIWLKARLNNIGTLTCKQYSRYK